MARFLGILFSMMVLFEGVSFSQDIRATTDDGRTVILKKDGSWQFAKPSKSSSEAGSVYQKPRKSSSVLKVKGERFLIWYDPSKWTQKRSDASKTFFEYKDGDLYAMIIAERIGMTMEGLKEIAVKNALAAAPDAKVIFEETRTVNGNKVLCMRIEGTIKSIQFFYYGYYYTGKPGTIQVITYTSRNLFSEYQSEMADFLNGLVVNE